MPPRVFRYLVAALLVTALAGCERSKSANPLSPSVAGPIPGVDITAPKPLEPGLDWEVSDDKQPIRLLIENAGSTGQRPLRLAVQISTDPKFGTTVFSREGLELGPNGRTALRLPDKLASDRTYYWRARALDGANTGPWSQPVKFTIVTPAELKAPTPVSPINGRTVSDNRPDFVFRNAPSSGPVGRVTYKVEVSRLQTFAGSVAIYTGVEGSSHGDTTVPTTAGLPWDATLYWRVRGSDGKVTGAWSATQVFKTPSQPAGPEPGPSPAPGTGGGGGSCASRDGNYIVNCIAQKYASYRRAGVSSEQRKANMRFLRDRIIEAGLCGGLQLGWNLKRGGPELSIDFIAERKGSQTYGYDIAIDYDNTGKEMQLYWGSDGPGSHFKAYDRSYSCN